MFFDVNLSKRTTNPVCGTDGKRRTVSPPPPPLLLVFLFCQLPENTAPLPASLQKILVDYLPGNPYSDLIQPVWCSYGMGARPVTVISTDFKIFFQRGWFHSDHVAGAIEMFWCLQQGGGEDGDCTPPDGGDSDMGEPGIHPLAGPV